MVEETVLGRAKLYHIPTLIPVTEDDVKILEAVFDYAELEDQYEHGLPVSQTQVNKAIGRILDACGDAYANNDGERPSYGN